jgi:starch synthase
LRIAIASSGRFHVLDLARELTRIGHEVIFYSLLPGRRAAAFGFPQERARSLLGSAWPLLALRRAARGRLRDWATNRLVQALDRRVAARLEPCEVFIGMSGVYLEAGNRARRQFGARFLLERGSRHIRSQRLLLGLDDSGSGGLLPPEVERELAGYEAADAIVVPSLHAEASFLERGFSPDRLFRNPYGVDLDLFHPTPCPPADPPVVLFVGDWSRRKGADVLARAILGLENVRLLHVGPPGDVPFPENGRFTRHRPVDQARLIRFYERAHVLALPSREDGFGMVLTQALACGLQVVASSYTGGPDLRMMIPDPDRVVVVPPEDPVRLGRALLAALDHAGAAGGLREGLGAVRDRVSWEAYGRRYDQFLKRLISREAA